MSSANFHAANDLFTASSSPDHISDSHDEQPLSIAVVSPDAGRRRAAIDALDRFSRGRIREFISFPSDIEEVAQALKHDYDVVIVDLDSDTSYALCLVQHICVDSQAIVIVFSANADPDVLLRCMRAGAREFLLMPLSHAEMADALGRASARRKEATPPPAERRILPRTNGRLLVFLSAKGGAGVTTLASNFAVSLAEESRQRTLLIDLNLPLGDAALNLGIRSDYSTINAFKQSSRLDFHLLESLLVRHSSGLYVLSAPSEMDPFPVADDAITTLLNISRQNFDFVVVDAGLRVDPHRAFPFDESTSLYLVTQVGIPELRNSNRLIKQLPPEGGPQLEIVVNRCVAGSQEISDENLAKALTKPVQWKIPNDYGAVRRMQNSATPLTEEDSEISRAIRRMTRTACGLPPANSEKKKGRGLFFGSRKGKVA